MTATPTFRLGEERLEEIRRWLRCAGFPGWFVLTAGNAREGKAWVFFEREKRI